MKNAAEEQLSVPGHIHHVADDLKHVVVMNSRNGQIFGLDNSAAVIWNALAESGSESAAIAAVAERYGLEQERAAADVRGFLTDLLDAGLLARGAAE
jgi:PqqD family protein of HPr-rel-A system